jgi:hypothetical protein
MRDWIAWDRRGLDRDIGLRLCVCAADADQAQRIDALQQAGHPTATAAAVLVLFFRLRFGLRAVGQLVADDLLDEFLRRFLRFRRGGNRR